MLKAVRDMGDDTGRLGRMLHQASFLSGSLRSGEVLDWRTAAGWLARACASAAGQGRDDDEEDPNNWACGDEGPEEQGPDDDAGCTAPTWSARWNGDCGRCVNSASPDTLEGALSLTTRDTRRDRGPGDG